MQSKNGTGNIPRNKWSASNEGAQAGGDLNLKFGGPSWNFARKCSNKFGVKSKVSNRFNAEAMLHTLQIWMN